MQLNNFISSEDTENNHLQSMSYHCSVHDPQASRFWESHRVQKVSLSEWHGWSLASGHHTMKDTTSPRVHYEGKIKQSKILSGSPKSKRKFYHKHKLFCGKDIWKEGRKQMSQKTLDKTI